ncbi:alpha/beta fold hydrolase [Inquilinus limosus]|uniref:Alpha/beta hydrolase n=1 Tax=Inquilinus limosus TaxID=171674 RepID=A0A211ZN27_9PROT|nr:alpha/beta hydrolase [Inquilinus limosus]OWJ66682.1 alpha/beta hydrolase [Inquilinus limosus]
MNKVIVAGLALAAQLGALMAPAQAQPTRPTVVLVHGAFADSSSWSGVIAILEKDGYKVVAAANPLRGVRTDADAVADVVKSIEGPVVLVGHSYGGSVISEAAEGRPNVKALVYVAAFAPEAGETALSLTGKFPGSTLGGALAPAVKLTSGGNDLYIQQQRFPEQFAADVLEAQARLMAAGQRPIAEAALSEASTAPAWKTVPSWFIYGSKDKNIPPAALSFMAERARSRQTVEVKGASHVVMVSHAPAVATLIEQAATAQ